MLGEDLDGDGAVEARVAGFGDLALAAGAKGALDLVRAERGARLEWLLPRFSLIRQRTEGLVVAHVVARKGHPFAVGRDPLSAS